MPSTSSAAAAGDSALTSLHNFSLLSYEVQARIINMACLLRSNQQSTGPAVLLDASTATSLALVSKTFNAMAVRTLYAHIRITRPSELRLLVASIVERPEVGSLMRSLHIGPNDRLPYEWHPFHTGRLLRAFDADGEQQDRYSEWSSINWRNDDSITSAHSTGIPPAINAIKHVTGTVNGWLNITSEGQEGWPRRAPGGPVRLGRLSGTPPVWEPFRSGLPTNVWWRRFFEAGTVVEMYVEQLAIYEDRQPSIWNQPSVCFPRLILEGTTAPLPAGNQQPFRGPIFFVSHEEVLARLALRNTITDRFDHPLLFSRSNIEWAAGEEPFSQGRASESLSWDNVKADALLWPIDDLRDPQCPLTQTTGGVLSLARALLGQTPQLRTLSLTGFLERTVCGPYSPKNLNVLQAANFGPPPDKWYSVPRPPLKMQSLANVQRLRVCGHVLDQGQAATIVGGAFSCLKALQWSFTKHIPDETEDGSVRILDTIATLLEVDPSAREAEDDDVSTPLSIDVRLNPRDVGRILCMAPDLATRAAWIEGKLPPVDSIYCSRRFRVSVTRAVGSGYTSKSREQEMQVMYDEGKEWFEKEAKGVGAYQKLRRGGGGR